MNTTITDALSSTSEENWYKVEITNGGYTRFNFNVDSSVDVSKLSYGWEIHLYEQGNAQAVYEYYGATSGINTGKVAIKPGIYYIKVIDRLNQPGVVNQKYNLRVDKVNEANWELESNDSSASATPIVIGTNYKGEFWNNDDVDYFKFTLNQTFKVTQTSHLNKCLCTLKIQ